MDARCVDGREWSWLEARHVVRSKREFMMGCWREGLVGLSRMIKNGKEVSVELCRGKKKVAKWSDLYMLSG